MKIVDGYPHFGISYPDTLNESFAIGEMLDNQHIDYVNLGIEPVDCPTDPFVIDMITVAGLDSADVVYKSMAPTNIPVTTDLITSFPVSAGSAALLAVALQNRPVYWP